MSENTVVPVRDRQLLEHIVDAFKIRLLWKDRDSRYLDCNQAFAEDVGFKSPQDVIGKTEFDMPWEEKTVQYHLQTDRKVMDSGEPLLSLEQELAEQQGRKSWILKSKLPVRDKDGIVNGVLVLYQDMTLFKELEKEKFKVDRAYRLLRNVNHAIMSINDETSLFDQVCRLVVDHGYKMCWIGKLESDQAKTIKPVASAGFIDGYLDTLKVTWADEAFGHGPTGTAAREGKTIINQDFLTNPQMLPWRESAVQHGYQSSIALAIKTDSGSVCSVLTIYAAEPNAFDRDEAEKLEELAQVLSFGREAILERQKRFDVLEKSVSALAATVESRDPYTAGHQSHVASLATAIASEMGLDPDVCQGIRLAGLIHDIGKMQIPIEILTKPTKLNDLEMAMIRMHPTVGYEILRDIPFPWPVAELVHQHHERYDGSGYPQGLKGSDILLGARILAVADAVEAISSHRPYRAALGMETALNEIEKNKETLFDPVVVDSCLRLLKDKSNGHCKGNPKQAVTIPTSGND
jgi:putative nucleotidyltransferase with HDIG domain/PAS domain S-box-containing protein